MWFYVIKLYVLICILPLKILFILKAHGCWMGFFTFLSVSLPFATTLVCFFSCLLKDSLRMSSLVFPLLISLADSFHVTFLLRKTNTHTHTLTILRNAIHNLVLSVFLAPFLTSVRAHTLATSDCSLGIGCAMHPLLSELLFILFLSRRVCPFFHLHQKNTKIQFKIYHVNHFFHCFTLRFFIQSW